MPEENTTTELPDDLSSALASVEVAEKIKAIAKNHRLHIDQEGELSLAVDLVIAGGLHPNKFNEVVQANLGLSREEAAAVTGDIDRAIFLPVRQSLMAIQTQKAGPEPEHPDLGSPHPSREEILEAISNPEATTREPQREPQGQPFGLGLMVGAEITPPAEDGKTVLLPVSATVEMPKIHQEKLTDIVRVPKKETSLTEINKRPIIPEDFKKRINVDPYKEPI